MTLVAADLLTPAGEVDGALFYPGLTSTEVSVRLGAYLTHAYTLATTLSTELQDTIARYYAYYRVWSDVVNMLTLSPASVSLGGEVSSSRLQTQIDAWIVKRDEWRTLYLALLPQDPNSKGVAPGGTKSIPIRFSF